MALRPQQWHPAGLEIVVLVGLQGSGKSTFVRRHLSAYLVISKDNWPNARNKAARQARAVDQALAAGRAVAVDNTNPTVEHRRGLVQAARAYDASATAVVFDSSVEECLARNAQRGGRDRVPDVAIYATAKRWQPPSAQEGFARRYHVQLTDDGDFDVRP